MVRAKKLNYQWESRRGCSNIQCLNRHLGRNSLHSGLDAPVRLHICMAPICAVDLECHVRSSMLYLCMPCHGLQQGRIARDPLTLKDFRHTFITFPKVSWTWRKRNGEKRLIIISDGTAKRKSLLWHNVDNLSNSLMATSVKGGKVQHAANYIVGAKVRSLDRFYYGRSLTRWKTRILVIKALVHAGFSAQSICQWKRWKFINKTNDLK